MRGSQKNRNYVIKWTPEFAYAVGLITTDGCLSKDGRHLDFTSKDIQLIRTFKKCLNLDVKIGYKTSSFTDKKYPHVQFSNVRLYKYFLEIGLTSKKSKTMGKLKIPDKYFFDFLRGHFDGDGYFYSYWDKRWPNSFMYYLNFISASLDHIKWLRDSIKSFLDINGAMTFATRNVHVLRYAKKGSSLILNKIYYKKNLPCLLRKRKKVEKVFSLSSPGAGI